MKKLFSKKQLLSLIAICYLIIIVLWLFSKGSIYNINGILPYPLKVSQSMNWIPFYLSSNMPTNIFITNMIFKLLIFMPLPFIFPSIFIAKKEYKAYLVKIIILAFAIEFIQVYLLIGYFDITDIIYYLIGATISFFIAKKEKK